MDHEGAAAAQPNGNGNHMGALVAALAKAQLAFPKILKDQTADAGKYSYKYADLAAVIEAVRKPLAENGLAYVQLMDVDGGHHVLITRLMHTAGAHLDSRYALASHERPQEMGSEITYARRYALSALLGVASEADDDAQAAQTSAEAGTRHEAIKDEAAILFPTPMEEEQAVAAFVGGLKDCPACGAKGTIIRGKPEWGGGWVCWARDKKKACGSKWSDKAQRTPEEAVAAVHRGTITAEVFAERARLLKMAGEISDEIQASEEDRKTWWNTYCPGATRANVDPKALGELVGYLNLRLDKAKAV